MEKVGNIGHDAHMGGAIVGIVVAVIYTPAKLLSMNAVYLGIMVLPLIVLAYLIWKKK